VIDKNKLDDALRRMGKEWLKKAFISKWTPECPTTGRCYHVSEVIKKYYLPEGQPWFVKIDGENHWFIKTSTGEIIDLAKDQYDVPIPYEKAKHHAFQPEPSKASKRLAQELGLEPKDA
jgi:hypothetical protein